MGSFFICLVFGFFINFDQSYGAGVFWLIMACVFYIPILFLPWYVSPVVNTDDNISHYKSEMYDKSYTLALWLSTVLPLYTVNYIVALSGGINVSQTIVIYEVLSLLTKGIFVAVCTDSHQERLKGIEREGEDNKRTDEARRSFLKYIFHEIRNPLNSVAMGIEILERSENLDSSDIECLLSMKDSALFMTDTLNDVLNMQKIEEGKLELDMAPFDIRASVTKVISTLTSAITYKNMTICQNFETEIPNMVVGDKYRIEHVISNLLGNAIKFSDRQKCITIKICRSMELTGATSTHFITSRFSLLNVSIDRIPLTISVIDEGPGISKDDQKKLFNNFVQIRPNTIQQGQGSGLGLAICKQIVNLHGGFITVKSEEGVGSTFSFTIPFKKCVSGNVMVSDILSLHASNNTEHCIDVGIQEQSKIQVIIDDDITISMSLPHILVVDGKYLYKF
jgi:signal transduction histidine kinase